MSTDRLPFLPRRQHMPTNDIGIVLLGEDGGEDLLRRLAEWLAVPYRIVYVDPQLPEELARFLDGCGIQCVSPNRLRGQTTAACRNEAMRVMLGTGPRPRFVQWLRCGSTLSAQWLRKASQYLAVNRRVGLVCGRVHLADQDTTRQRLQAARVNSPTGNCCTFPSEALVRTAAFETIAGFDERIETFEETEFVDRLRANGWDATRIDALMTQWSAGSAGWQAWFRQQYQAGYQESSLLARTRAPQVQFSRRLRWQWLLPAIVGCCIVTGLMLTGRPTTASVISVALLLTALTKIVLFPWQPPATLLREGTHGVADWTVLGISTVLKMCGDVSHVARHFPWHKNPKRFQLQGSYVPYSPGLLSQRIKLMKATPAKAWRA